MKHVACLLLVATLFSGCGTFKGYDSSSSNESTQALVGSQNNTVVDNSTNGGSGSSTLKGTPCKCIVKDENGVEKIVEPTWKPESERDGSLALVSCPGDIIKWTRAYVYRAVEEGEAEIEYLENTSVDTEDELRQTWRGELPGGEYTGQFTIEYGSGEKCEGFNPNPSERND